MVNLADPIMCDAPRPVQFVDLLPQQQERVLHSLVELIESRPAMERRRHQLVLDLLLVIEGPQSDRDPETERQRSGGLMPDTCRLERLLTSPT